MYQFGIIGPGNIAQKFAEALALTEGAVLGAVAARDRAKAAAFAECFGGAEVFDSYEALAQNSSVDVVYIATPHALHAETAILCLSHGKAVLCEKPMALSARQVQSMVDVAQQHKVFLMEAMWTRFLPMMESILGLVTSGKIGEIRYVRGDFGFAAPFDPNSRLYNPHQGGGSLLDVGVYPLFLALQLLGMPHHITAYGRLASTGVDETCHAILGYDNGASAIITSSIVCDTTLTAEIAGTKGIIRIPAAWYKQWQYEWQPTGEESRHVVLDPVTNGFEYQIREVMHCLLRGLPQSPWMPLHFSLGMARVMDAIREQIGVRYPGE